MERNSVTVPDDLYNKIADAIEDAGMPVRTSLVAAHLAYPMILDYAGKCAAEICENVQAKACEQPGERFSSGYCAGAEDCADAIKAELCGKEGAKP